MYPVSDDYVKAIQSRTTTCSWSGTLTLSGGTSVEFGTGQMVQGKTRLVRECCTGDDLKFGTVSSAELTIGLRLDVDRYSVIGGAVSLTYSLDLPGGGAEPVPLGEFLVSDATRSGDVLTIHAYDDVAKLDSPYSAQLRGKAYDMLSLACGSCGVRLGMTREEVEALPNGKVDTYVYEPDKYVDTWRDVVGYVAGMTGTIAVVDPARGLVLRQYLMKPQRDIPASWRYSSEFADYRTGYVSVKATYAAGKSVDTGDAGGTGLTYDMGTNPLMQWPLQDARRAAVKAIATQLSTVSYVPFEVKTPQDPSLMPGDVLSFSGGTAPENALCAITSMELSVNGSMTLKGTGANPRLRGSKTQTQRSISDAVAGIDTEQMYYYTFESSTDAKVGDGGTVDVVTMQYVTTKNRNVEFHAEVDCEVETTESGDSLGDCVVWATYVLNGVVLDAKPTETWQDGRHLLHLMRTWQSTPNVNGTFVVRLSAEGGTVSVPARGARAYMAGQGLAGKNDWDGIVRASDTFPGVAPPAAVGRYASDVSTSFQTPVPADVSDRFAGIDVASLGIVGDVADSASATPGDKG